MLQVQRSLFFSWLVTQQLLSNLPNSASQVISLSPTSHCAKTSPGQSWESSPPQHPSRAASQFLLQVSEMHSPAPLTCFSKCHPSNILQDNRPSLSTNWWQEKRVGEGTIMFFCLFYAIATKCPMCTMFESWLEQTNYKRHLWNYLGNLNMCWKSDDIKDNW